MASSQAYPLVASAALAILGIQALARPPANLVSLRSNSHDVLDGMWRANAASGEVIATSLLPVYQTTVAGCGDDSDLEAVVARVADVDFSVKEMSRNIYRGDIIQKVIDDTPGWRIKLMQLAYGLGLWSGDLDDDPPPTLTTDRIEAARRFSAGWFDRTMTPVVCDAASALKARSSKASDER